MLDVECNKMKTNVLHFGFFRYGEINPMKAFCRTIKFINYRVTYDIYAFMCARFSGRVSCKLLAFQIPLFSCNRRVFRRIFADSACIFQRLSSTTLLCFRLVKSSVKRNKHQHLKLSDDFLKVTRKFSFSDVAFHFKTFDDI